MLTNHLLTGLSFGLSLSIVSWMVGIIGNALLLKTSYYERLSHLNFIPSKALNKALGVERFKWIVKNTFFKFLNQGIRVDGKHTDLSAIRHQMTLAEISHLIGFLFVASFALFQTFNLSLVFGLSMMVPNAMLNGYPSLLQQENKRRIDQVLKRQRAHG
jgi:hypothetical protein